MFMREPDIKQEPADEIGLIAKGIQPREGDIARAHHQRHEIQAHAFHDRHGEQEHHGRAVRREELIVEIGPEEVFVRATPIETA